MVALVSFCLLAVLVRVKDDTDCIEVIDLVKRDALIIHLVPDGIRSLDSFLDFVFESGSLQSIIDRGNEVADFSVFVADIAVDLFCDLVECLRFFVSEPDVLHLGLDAVETESMGERNEYEHCLAEDLVSLVFRHELDGPAVVKSVCKFDKNYAYIVVKGKKDTLEVLGLHALLLCLVFIVKYGLDFSQTIYQSCYLLAEKVLQIINCVCSVLHHIMKKGSNNGFVAEAYVADNNLSYGNRMKYIWFA